MAFGLSLVERINRARADLRLGVPIVLSGAQGPALVMAAETATADRLDALRDPGLVLAITRHRAETLKARPYDGDLARIIVPRDGGLGWLRAMADPADDLRHPMKGPFHCARDGTADLHRAAIALVKTAQLLPAALVLESPPAALIAGNDLTELPFDLLAEALARESQLAPVVNARLPMVASQAGRVHIFRPRDGGEEHYAIEIGQPDRTKPVLARLHSACFTGDVLGSLKCDCGPQLNAALAQMGAEGAGVLLYLNQEGRGIGLANKMRAYSLQDQGFDTVEANHRLGFEDDERDFRIGAGLLRQMGFGQVRLLTNNPRKVDMLNAHGLKVVDRVALRVGETAQNARYLATKAAKSGHLL
ncbi:MAG: GTP cyclohydrolase II RibA [Roseibaca calidilacus]|uniref:GTP cyclohydrolase-2 n=1 Tax=Roseibaca calidilacus TaxID=1666912 RepID=A0A0N8K767_9RHOB|nr:GTP cyclohydrolase II [Roseibaca calidilacus]KPP90889.1 MAG: GTP cyclohydrolase II RibA [Roseibaca calidilacus]CUX83744.1 GTP cyclohydrolase II [Roseibaca calidilacus]